MHLLENVGHALLGIPFHAHPLQLCLGDCTLIVTLFDLLVRQEVLSHDPTDLLEVRKDLCSSIFGLDLGFLLSGAKFVKLIIHVQCQLWTCTTKEK